MESFWSGVKKYWQIIVGFLAAVFLFVITRKSPDPREVLRKSNESHKDEVEAIRKAHETEKAAREEAVKKHQESVEQVEKAFKEISKKIN